MSRSKAKPRLDCFGMGIIPVDFLYTVKHLPPAGGKADATDGCIQGGGPVPNVMVGLSRLGLRTGVIAVVGNDWLGQFSIEELKNEGVDHRYVIKKKRPSAAALGFIEEGTGRRTIVLNRQIFITPRDLKTSTYPIPRLLHLDGRDLEATVKLAKWGRRAGAIVSFDIGSVRNDVSPVLPYVDHLVVADAFALPFTKSRSVRAALRKLAACGPSTVVITEGTHGATGFENGGFVSHPAFRVKSIDTTGAGDAFHTGYLYALLEGRDLAYRLRFGAAVAALKCTRLGARTGAPTLYQVNQFLKKKPRTYA